MTEPSSTTASSGLTLKANVVWTFGGNVIAAACQWGLLALLTRTIEDAETGQFVMAMAICTPVFMFAGLDLRTLQVTDGSNRFRLSEYFALRISVGLLATLLVPSGAFLYGADVTTVAVVAGVALAKYVELISDMLYGVMQRAERMDLVSRSVVLHGILSAVATGLGVLATGSMIAGVFVAAIVLAAILGLNDLPKATRLHWQDRPEAERSLSNALRRLLTLDMARPAKLIVEGGPLAVKQLVVSLNTQVSRYFVGGLGYAAVGVFGPIASAVTAATTVSRALNQSIAARLGRLAVENRDDEFRRLIGKVQIGYLALGLCGVGVAWQFGELLLTIAYRPDFAKYDDVLILIVVAVAIQYQSGILDIAMVTLRRVNVLVPISTLSLGVTCLACWLLIPILELRGAACGMIAGRVVQVIALNVLITMELRDRRAAVAGRCPVSDSLVPVVQRDAA